MTGKDFDLHAVTAGEVADSGVAHAGALVAFAEAIVGDDDEALASARAAVLGEIGPEALVDAAAASILATTGIDTTLSTAGGTSDGRFIAPYGVQVVELGPVNDSIHKLNEHVRVADLPVLAEIYRGIIERLLAD